MLRIAPDVEQIVVDYLRAHPSITAIVEMRVSTVEPAAPVLPLLLVELSDGDWRDHRVRTSFEASIDVEAKGVSKQEASLLARTAQAALLDMVGFAHPAGHVVDASELAGLDWSPDTAVTPPGARYEFSVLITAHN